MFSPQARTEKGQWWASLEGLWGHRSTFPQVLVCLGRGWLSFALCPYWVLLALTFFLPLLLQCSPPATASADKGSKFKLILCPIPNVLGFPMIKRAYTSGLWQKHRRKRSKQSSRLQEKAWSAELHTWSLGWYFKLQAFDLLFRCISLSVIWCNELYFKKWTSRKLISKLGCVCVCVPSSLQGLVMELSN